MWWGGILGVCRELVVINMNENQVQWTGKKVGDIDRGLTAP